MDRPSSLFPCVWIVGGGSSFVPSTLRSLPTPSTFHGPFCLPFLVFPFCGGFVGNQQDGSPLLWGSLPHPHTPTHTERERERETCPSRHSTCAATFVPSPPLEKGAPRRAWEGSRDEPSERRRHRLHPRSQGNASDERRNTWKHVEGSRETKHQHHVRRTRITCVEKTDVAEEEEQTKGARRARDVRSRAVVVRRKTNDRSVRETTDRPYAVVCDITYLKKKDERSRRRVRWQTRTAVVAVVA